MEVAMPMSGTAIDCYEDMFKEITRKLYGEDGLPELSTTERLPSNQDRGLTPIDYDVDNPILKPEEHLTAFGLAALMQNGFPTTGILNSTFQQHKSSTSTANVDDRWLPSEDTLQWTQSKIATYNPSQKLFRCAECDCVGYLPRVAEHWLGTHSNLRAFQCPQCPYESAWARCVRMHLTRHHNIVTDETSDTLAKNNPVLQEITKYLHRLKGKLENTAKGHIVEDFHQSSSTQHGATQTVAGSSEQNQSSPSKRYTCTYCPYATDRRDLFTRHENIHREEKPFQCYVCQKQFNRADHVKKHFLRMHREHPYDLNRIRRHPPKNASGLSYYQKYNANNTNQPSESTPPVPTLPTLPINPLSIPNGFNNLNRNSTNVRPSTDVKPSTTIATANTKSMKSTSKKKGERRFSCCYCSWSGVDNWCLKRHMNTHLKPFVCGLCDYKAARSERLATHVLKVHNKRACGKCSYLADDPAQLTIHQQEHHPLEHRNRSSSTNNILRHNSFNTGTTSAPTPSCSQQGPNGNIKSHDQNTAGNLLAHSNSRPVGSEHKTWKSHHSNKPHGAARLFNYLEASDGSEPENESRGPDEMINRGGLSMNLNQNQNHHRIQSDFLEAGDVGSSSIDDEEAEEMELPLFVCPMCGCEFEDDLSLETHQFAHHQLHSTASPAIIKYDNSKENVNPNNKYRCKLCDYQFETQSAIMAHMLTHSSLNVGQLSSKSKRSRKQSRPKKMVDEVGWDEVEVMRQLDDTIAAKKYQQRALHRKRYYCMICRDFNGRPYHTRASLALHHYWKHSHQKFNCDFCDQQFRHKYQCILHAARVHFPKVFRVQTVPKEPAHNNPVQSSQEHSHHFFANTQPVPVPETSSNSSASHKLGMSFFDHSFINATSHMPIIIPTFPPN